MIVVFFKEGISTPASESSIVEKCDMVKTFGANTLLPQGKRQLHRLGVMIREQYEEFLDRKINPTELALASMKKPVHLDSMFALLSGLLTDPRPILRDKNDPVLLPKFPVDLDTINSIDFDSALPANQTVFNYKRYSKSDQVKDFSLFDLSSTSGECPKFKEFVGLKEEDSQSLLNYYIKKESGSILESIVKLKQEYLCVNISQDSLSTESLDEITDFLNTVQFQNLTNIMKPGVPAFDVLERTRQVLYILYEEKYYEKIYKLTASSSILELTRLLKRKASRSVGPEDPYLEKLGVFSGSDNLLTSLLWVLGNLDATCYTRNLNNSIALDKCPKLPNFASNMVFELHSGNAERWFVKVRYNGKYLRVCPLNADISVEDQSKSGFPCELDQFIQRVVAKIEPEWKAACGAPVETPKDNYSQTVTLMVVFLIVFFVFTLLAVVFVLYYYTKTSKSPNSSKVDELNFGFDISFDDPHKRTTNYFKMVDRETIGRSKIKM